MIKPVSYTHLDVYKRQRLRQYKNPYKGAQQQRPARQQHRRLFCHKKKGYGDPGHGAVSYTHLDVYKRQVFRLCIEVRP